MTYSKVHLNQFLCSVALFYQKQENWQPGIHKNRLAWLFKAVDHIEKNTHHLEPLLVFANVEISLRGNGNEMTKKSFSKVATCSAQSGLAPTPVAG